MKYEEVIQKIKNKTPFAFSRWGDGEFLNVNGANGQNCDGNIYYEDLGQELKSILSTKQDYYIGVQTLMDWSIEESKKYDQDWCDSDVFHKASMEGNIDELSDVLMDTHVVYIGNETHSKLPFINEFITIPYSNVWLRRDQLMSVINDTFGDIHKVYLFSAGMATNVFIDRLWDVDNTNIYIDAGSAFDPYVGRKTRGYHSKLEVKEL